MSAGGAAVLATGRGAPYLAGNNHLPLGYGGWP